MSFNSDLRKQAQEIIFCRKLKNVSYPPLVFNNANVVSLCKSQKHLGILLDSKLAFEEHYKTILNMTNRTKELLRKFQSLLPRAALVTIYKAFFRPHLDYGDVLYDQAFIASFHEKLDSIQYNVCLAQELGLESLQFHR